MNIILLKNKCVTIKMFKKIVDKMFTKKWQLNVLNWMLRMKLI